MGGELVTNLPSNRSGNNSPTSYTEIFEKQFPNYLAIGMTEYQYWDGDCMLPKYYREAEKIRIEKFNQQAWLQGMYIYDALARISPILHAYAKKGTKAKPYLAQPYALTSETAAKQQEEKEKAKADKALAIMRNFTARTNKKFGRA